MTCWDGGFLVGRYGLGIMRDPVKPFRGLFVMLPKAFGVFGSVAIVSAVVQCRLGSLSFGACMTVAASLGRPAAAEGFDNGILLFADAREDLGCGILNIALFAAVISFCAAFVATAVVSPFASKTMTLPLSPDSLPPMLAVLRLVSHASLEKLVSIFVSCRGLNTRHSWFPEVLSLLIVGSPESRCPCLASSPHTLFAVGSGKDCMADGLFVGSTRVKALMCCEGSEFLLWDNASLVFGRDCDGGGIVRQGFNTGCNRPSAL